MTGKFDKLYEMALAYAPKLVLATIVLLLGLWIVSRITAFVAQALDRSGLNEDVLPFAKSFVSILLKLLLLVSVAGIVGIETTSFVAALAALGFAVGMALQGSLGNLAAGILVLIFKPYKVGDFVEIGEYKGFVIEIQILNTVLNTLDNRHVIIPNGATISDVIVNASGNPNVRLEFFVYMPYDERFPHVRNIIETALAQSQGILSDPPPLVGIEAFDSHSIQLAVRPFTRIEDQESAFYTATQNVKAALGAAGIRVAYSEGVEMGRIEA